MKKQHLNLFGLCTLAALCSISCDDEGNGKYTCDRAAECAQNLGGDVSYWKCNIEYRKCEAQVPEHCFNGVIDSGKETGKDCGGVCVSESKLKDSSAFKCDNKVTCTADADCKSNACVNKVCSEKTCSTPNDCPNNGDCVPVDGSDTRVCVSCIDGAKNQDESDVDCGGSCSAKCEAGKACNTGSDCVKGVCEGGKCSDVEVKSAEPDNLLINEIMVAEDVTASSKDFFTYNNNGPECKFVEIINISNSVIDAGSCSLILDRKDAAGKTSTTPLSGTIPAKGMIVAYLCDKEKAPDGIALPNGTFTATLGNSSNITQGGTYDAYIKCGETEGTHTPVEKAKKGTSMNRPVDGEMSEQFIFHADVDSNTGKVPASPGYCANGGLYAEGCVSTCGNNKKDDSETDVDCGGACATKCANGKACSVGNDCASGSCDGGKCVEKGCSEENKDCGEGFVCNEDNWTCEAEVSCSDGIQNQDETDVDCGGKCGPCAIGKKCSVAKDCVSNECSDKVCTGDAPAVASLSDLVINEVMGSPKTSDDFAIQTGTKQNEFIEIINLKNEAVSVDGIFIKLAKDKSEIVETDKSIELSGMIPAKGVLVVSDKEIPMPKDGMNLSGKNPSLTNGSDYAIWLSDGTNNSGLVKRMKLSTGNGKSQNRSEDLGSDGTLIWHDQVSSNTAKLLNSPGYCANGGLFSEGCKADCGNGSETCGRNCAKCENGDTCKGNEDCASGECTGNVCTGNAPTTASLSELIINEVMGSPKTSDDFATQTGTKQSEFIEIVNLKNEAVSVDGIFIKLAKDKSEIVETDKSIELSGMIPAKGVLVVSDKEIPMPKDGMNLSGKNPSMTNGSDYAIWLSDGTNNSGLVKRMKLSTGNGKSQNRSEDLGSNETLIWHDQVSSNTDKKSNSPGYCANGGLFSEDCVAPVTPSIESLDEAAKAYYDLQMKCWNESEGSEDELKQEFNAHNLCEKEIKDYVISMVSKECADFENMKVREEACQNEDCINELYASWEPAQAEEVLDKCYKEKYPEE